MPQQNTPSSTAGKEERLIGSYQTHCNAAVPYTYLIPSTPFTMADTSHKTDGPSPLSQEGYDESLLPDFHREFLSEEHILAFANALSAPDPSPSTDDLRSHSPSTQTTGGWNTPSRASFDSGRSKLGGGASGSSLFITAQNDWAPVIPTKGGKATRRKGEREKKGRKEKRKPRRSRDETREGYLYTLLKWPLLAIVGGWVIGLGASYMLTRLYIWLYGKC